MRYKVERFIGVKAENEGWRKVEEANLVELRSESEKIKVKIEGEIIETEIEGKGNIMLFRDGKIAKLTNKTKGKVIIGDKIYLLNQEAEKEFYDGKRELFEAGAVLIEVLNDEVEKKQDIFIKEKSFSQEKNNKSVNLILGLVVFVLLAVGTFLGYQKRTEGEQKKIYEEIKSQVMSKINEAESVKSANIDTALQLAQEAESIANNAGTAEKKYANELGELRKKIAETKRALGGENVEYEVAYDTTLIVEGENQFKGMAIKDGQVYLWSANLGQVNFVDPVLKSQEKITSDERIKNWLGIFNNGEKWYGYDQNKIYEIKRNELVETEIKNVSSVGEMTGWGGLTYVLDNGNKNIDKLSGGEGKFWLKEGTNLDEETNGISIDSNIWVLGKSGKIYKYSRGIKENFEVSTITSLSSVKELRTSDKVNFIAYVTDDNTVVIYGKDGKILGKYNFSKIKVNDIGIEDKTSSVLVLASNGKIYRIKIK